MKHYISKYVTAEFAYWNVSILIIGLFLGTWLGFSEQFLNLVRSGLTFCGDKF